jgi:hypothetical protein
MPVSVVDANGTKVLHLSGSGVLRTTWSTFAVISQDLLLNVS